MKNKYRSKKKEKRSKTGTHCTNPVAITVAHNRVWHATWWQGCPNLIGLLCLTRRDVPCEVIEDDVSCPTVISGGMAQIRHIGLLKAIINKEISHYCSHFGLKMLEKNEMKIKETWSEMQTHYYINTEIHSHVEPSTVISWRLWDLSGMISQPHPLFFWSFDWLSTCKCLHAVSSTRGCTSSRDGEAPGPSPRS